MKEKEPFNFLRQIIKSIIIAAILTLLMIIYTHKKLYKYDEEGKWMRCPEISITGKDTNQIECWWLVEPKEK